jgi:hypothetical protein
MSKRSFVVPILISIFALIAVPVSVSAVTQKSSEINLCVDWVTKEIKYSKYWEKCPARHTAMTMGSEGSSAYEIAVANGFEGTVDEWLTSLEGKDGRSSSGSKGATGAKGDTGLQGDQGVQGATGPAGPTIRSDRDFGISTADGYGYSMDGRSTRVASWSLPANSSGVWSYTVVLRTYNFDPYNEGYCHIEVKDHSGDPIGLAAGDAYWFSNSARSVGFGTGYVVVDDAATTDSYRDAASGNRDITVSPHFELWCNALEEFDVDAKITMVEASDVNNSIAW